MADIRKVTEDFSVAPQIGPEDVQAAADQGFVMLINNRPDGEVPGQPTSEEMRAQAEKAGLGYVFIPFVGLRVGGPADEGDEHIAEAVREAAESAKGPVLAFCRSGTRSITAWSLGQAAAGKRTREDLLKLGAGAGYDLSGALGG